jgi:hypothetical protein
MDNFIPYTFICPLSREIMENPFLDLYGDSYEYNEIVEYIRINKKSPLNFKPLELNDIIPNRVLKNTIEEYIEMYSIPKIENGEMNIKWKNSEFCKNKTYYLVSLYCNININNFIDYIDSKCNDILINNEKKWIPEYDCKIIIDKIIIYIKWKTNQNFRLKIYGEISQMYNFNIVYENLPMLNSIQKNECLSIINRILESNDYISLLDILQKVFDNIKNKYNLVWNKNKTIDRIKNII